MISPFQLLLSSKNGLNKSISRLIMTFLFLFFYANYSYADTNSSFEIIETKSVTSLQDTNLNPLEWFQLGEDINGFGNAGRAVSMPDSNTVATGSPSENESGGGVVRIYDFVDNTWTQRGQNIVAESITDGAGRAICMPDDNTVAIGAPFNDNASGEDAGHVRIYDWNGTAWVQRGEDLDGEEEGDFFGFAISMANTNTIVIGAPLHDNIRGETEIYDWNGSAWVQRGNTLDGENFNDQSGMTVSMPNPNTVGIGAQANSNENGSGAGQVRIYDWNGNTWTQRGEDINGEAGGDNSGDRISMPNSNVVAISASLNDNENGANAGHVRVYDWDGSTWTQRGEDIDGLEDSDRFGFSVSMPDAITLAIGARDSRNDNGFLAGQVSVFRWTGSFWEQRGESINGESAADRSGFSVNMPDANHLAIGALFNNNENGRDAGHIRVFTFCGEDEITGIIPNLGTEKTSTVSLYPNPSIGIFHLKSNSGQDMKKVMVYNLRGELIKEVDADSNQLSLNLSDELAGSYLIKIIDDISISTINLSLQK